MKKWILFLIIFLQLSCGRRNNDHTENEDSIADSVENIIIENVADEELITESENDISFSYTNISKYEYETLKKDNKNEILSVPEEKFEETDKGLSIKLSNGKTLSFVNNDGEECESCIEIYRYVGFSTAHNLHVYYQHLYESTEFFLVNEQGGAFHIWGEPSFLNGSNLMFCISGLLVYDIDNGFQIYEIKENIPVLLKQYDITDWIPNYAFWINNDELVMEQDFPYDGNSVPPSKYIKLKIIG